MNTVYSTDKKLDMLLDPRTVTNDAYAGPPNLSLVSCDLDL